MSREQSLRAPAVQDTEPVESLAPSGEDPRLVERLTQVAQEARWAFADHRAELAGTLNGLLERLPSEVRPEEAAPVLHRLLGGELDGLEDLEGVPCAIVATRALLSLGYPHALEVAPERLEALRRWERRSRDVPWGGLLGVLGVASVLQAGLVILGAPGIRHLFGASAAVLAGFPVVLSWEQRLSNFWATNMNTVWGGQFALTCGALLLTMAVGTERKGRPVARWGFFGLGALGVLVGAAQFPFFGMVACGTLASAAGALLAGWLLRDG
jgi:hypothetical protein